MTDIRDLGRTALATAGLLLVGATAAWGDTTERVSVSSRGKQGNSDSISPSISAGGRFVAFASNATNLIPGDTNGAPDVFVHDRRTGRTERVSVSSSGAQASAGGNGSYLEAISADGRSVAFLSDATNLVPGGSGGEQVFVHDRRTGRTELVSVATSGAQGNNESVGGASLSAGGRLVAFASEATNLVPGDTNGTSKCAPCGEDVFVRDRGPAAP